MTREEAKKILEAYIACESKKAHFECSEYNCDDTCPLLYDMGTVGEYNEAINMAIQALSQEPTEKPMTVDEMEREYEKSKALFHKTVECDDAISRKKVEEMIKAEMPERGAWEIGGNKGDVEKQTVCEVCVDLLQSLNELPPVTPSRHVNCEIAEHDGNGCLGYSHYGDDFPIKECLHCPKYTSYEE